MRLRSLTPNLLVNDVLETAEHYRDVLGFEFVMGVADGTQDAVFELVGRPLGFAMMQRDGVEIMFQSHESMAVDLPGMDAPSGAPGVFLYIDVDDIDALWAELGTRASVVKEPHTTFYGAREFSVRDCNGFLIGFAHRPQQP